ncbi:MAG: hypothetical protein N2042_00835 [Thermodesulfovibrio sp.]|nr:hypothetical protein [Thermodesulfovibrio sp.]
MKDRKKRLIIIRVEPELLKRIKEASEFKGLSMSAFVRMATLQAIREVEEEIKRLSKGGLDAKPLH